jgi:hypothetical protein
MHHSTTTTEDAVQYSTAQTKGGDKLLEHAGAEVLVVAGACGGALRRCGQRASLHRDRPKSSAVKTVVEAMVGPVVVGGGAVRSGQRRHRAGGM